ncbi:MAG: ABC transporter ATP-binding protein [Actinomycetota bacterium]|nr:ABC transporter ATP-binding protein [Actinomycetota bacterium]
MSIDRRGPGPEPGRGPAGTAALAELRGVRRTYGTGPSAVIALDDVDLAVRAGELVAVHGRSGSGKTTLLNVIGGLDRADEGTVEVCGRDLTAASDTERTELRRSDVAFVFQSFGLLPMLSAAENVEVPLRLNGCEVEERRQRVTELLDLVGLGRRGRHRPAELSGGEQQRVAIARALAASPRLLIADEPTGQLDSRTGRVIMDLLAGVVRGRGLAAVVATHDASVIGAADARIQLSDGRVLAAG